MARGTGGWRCPRQTCSRTVDLGGPVPACLDTLSSDVTSWLMTSSCPVAAAVGRRRSPTPSWSARPSRRCCSTAPAIGASWRSRGWRLGQLFPYLPKQPGYNKRVGALLRSSSGCSTCGVRRASCGDRVSLLDATPIPCGQSRETARRSSCPATPPTAAVARTPATTGDFDSCSSAHPTACRSALNWPPPRSPNARSPRRSPSASRSPGDARSSPTRS